MTPFPWRDAMRFGFGVLKLPSQSFWGLTPRELASAFEALTPAPRGAPAQRELLGLMAAFPDRET